MADLEASSPLARHLSTAQYFAFVRRLVRTADRCVIDAGGIVGRHAGDGIVAFFLADTAGSDSAAARACITAARAVRDTLPDIAARSEISVAECSFRFGLHWGATLYMGRIQTGGRSEVTALGDEVNEAARIEACATGGRTLASKSLIERLNRVDADALGLDTGHTTYTPLADLATATDKARRDAALDRRLRDLNATRAITAAVSGGQRISTFDRVGSIGRCVVERLSELEKWRIAELSAQGLPSRLIGKEIGRAHRDGVGLASAAVASSAGAGAGAVAVAVVVDRTRGDLAGSGGWRVVACDRAAAGPVAVDDLA